MNTEKMVYWAALAVFALGISHEYRDGKFLALHRAVGQAESTLCQMTTRAEQAMAMARFLTTSEPATASDALVATRDLDLAKAELVRQQVQSQAELLREQARARISVRVNPPDVEVGNN
jgi:hypothetical protein